MGYPPLENLLPKSNHSVYRLVRMSALRATELADGAKPLLPVPPEEKTATIVLEEIHAGKVVLNEVADQFKPADQPKTEKAVE